MRNQVRSLYTRVQSPNTTCVTVYLSKTLRIYHSSAIAVQHRTNSIPPFLTGKIPTSPVRSNRTITLGSNSTQMKSSMKTKRSLAPKSSTRKPRSNKTTCQDCSISRHRRINPCHATLSHTRGWMRESRLSLLSIYHTSLYTDMSLKRLPSPKRSRRHLTKSRVERRLIQCSSSRS